VLFVPEHHDGAPRCQRELDEPNRLVSELHAEDPASAGTLGGEPVGGVASCSTECVSLFRFVSFRPAGSLAEVTPVVGGSRVPG